MASHTRISKVSFTVQIVESLRNSEALLLGDSIIMIIGKLCTWETRASLIIYLPGSATHSIGNHSPPHLGPKLLTYLDPTQLQLERVCNILHALTLWTLMTNNMEARTPIQPHTNPGTWAHQAFHPVPLPTYISREIFYNHELDTH